MTDSIKSPINFSFNIGHQSSTPSEESEKSDNAPFCMAVLGDFSGNADKTNHSDIRQRAFKSIDRFDYDDVLASFKINLSLGFDHTDDVIQVPIEKLKDFHPDQLFKNVKAFKTLRDLRQRLQNNASFDAAAIEIQNCLQPIDNAQKGNSEQSDNNIVQPSDDTSKINDENISDNDLLDSILQATDTQNSDVDDAEIENNKIQQQSSSLINGFIKEILTHRVKVSSDPRKPEMLAAIDESISDLMRSILHHEKFQAMESRWLALRFLVRRIKMGKSIKLFLFDVTKQEMSLDLAAEDLTQSGLYSQFGESEYGDINWSLIAGDFQFNDSIDDIVLLSQLGYISKSAGATFISAAHEKLIGCESFETTPAVNKWNYDMDKNVSEAWRLLRQSDVASHLSLALPSFLVREPYSAMANPIKSFSFEELELPIQHRQYLWANAAFLKVEQFARAYSKNGWKMQLSDVINIEDLPMHSYQENEKTMVKPCAEIALTNVGAELILRQGIIPLWSIKNIDKIHSAEFITLAE